MKTVQIFFFSIWILFVYSSLAIAQKVELTIDKTVYVYDTVVNVIGNKKNTILIQSNCEHYGASKYEYLDGLVRNVFPIQKQAKMTNANKVIAINFYCNSSGTIKEVRFYLQCKLSINNNDPSAITLSEIKKIDVLINKKIQIDDICPDQEYYLFTKVFKFVQ